MTTAIIIMLAILSLLSTSLLLLLCWAYRQAIFERDQAIILLQLADTGWTPEMERRWRAWPSY